MPLNCSRLSHNVGIVLARDRPASHKIRSCSIIKVVSRAGQELASRDERRPRRRRAWLSERRSSCGDESERRVRCERDARKGEGTLEGMEDPLFVSAGKPTIYSSVATSVFTRRDALPPTTRKVRCESTAIAQREAT